MKSVMLSIKPYYLFLIIAKTMGWKTDKEKTVEVRKTRPKDENWNKIVILYCTKDYYSLNEVPIEYRMLMRLLLGKVIGEFVCDLVTGLKANNQIQAYYNGTQETCLTPIEIVKYANGKMIYYWHISNLKIYDEPKELSEFKKCTAKTIIKDGFIYKTLDKENKEIFKLKRPPQSWCYVMDGDKNAN